MISIYDMAANVTKSEYQLLVKFIKLVNDYRRDLIHFIYYCILKCLNNTKWYLKFILKINCSDRDNRNANFVSLPFHSVPTPLADHLFVQMLAHKILFLTYI